MIRRSFRFGIRVGLLAGIAFAIFKIVQARRPIEPLPTPDRAPWPPVPTPAPQVIPAAEPAPTTETEQDAEPVQEPEPDRPVKAARPPAAPAKKRAAKKNATAKPASRRWVEAQGQICPLSHPIKAKLASRIYHLPGMRNYNRTRPDRCYATEAAAERDGFHPAKR